MHRPNSHRFLLLLVVLGFITSRVPVSFADTLDVNSSDRDRQYLELAVEVEAMQRYLNLLKRVVQVVKPAVVHIVAEKETNRGHVEEAGSGIIIKVGDKTCVLTNRHVVKEADLNKIHLHLSDGRLIHPLEIWTDEGTDVAVMRVSGDGLVAARVGDSRKLQIGDFVLAVGSPFGLSHSITYGIISAKGRRDLKLGSDGVRYQDFLQTDAAINPGNSGGPLLNLRGEVVGINTAIASNSGHNEGIGFSIPINLAMVVAKQLVETGQVVRAFLGVHLDPRFSVKQALKLGLKRGEGARVSGITPNSPAEAAMLKAGDVVLEFDGIRIEDDGHLVNLVSLTPVDKEVTVIVFRDKERLAIKVKVGNRNDFNSR